MLHSVRIDRTAERTGIEYIESLVPVVDGGIEYIIDIVSPKFETFDKQVFEPRRDIDTADFSEKRTTAERGSEQIVVVGTDERRVVENNSWYRSAGNREKLFVSFENHVENDVLVGWVRVVVVAVPIGSSYMKFDIASPKTSVNTQFRIEGVRTGIEVRNARRDYFDCLAKKGLLSGKIQTIEPNI